MNLLQDVLDNVVPEAIGGELEVDRDIYRQKTIITGELIVRTAEERDRIYRELRNRILDSLPQFRRDLDRDIEVEVVVLRLGFEDADRSVWRLGGGIV